MSSISVLADSLLDIAPCLRPCLVRLVVERADHDHTKYCKKYDDGSDGEDTG